MVCEYFTNIILTDNKPRHCPLHHPRPHPHPHCLPRTWTSLTHLHLVLYLQPNFDQTIRVLQSATYSSKSQGSASPKIDIISKDETHKTIPLSVKACTCLLL